MSFPPRYYQCMLNNTEWYPKLQQNYLGHDLHPLKGYPKDVSALCTSANDSHKFREIWEQWS